MAIAPVTAKDVADADDERDDQPQQTPQQIADYWNAQVQSAEKRRKPFVTRGKQIIKRYRNKRTLTTLGVPLATRRMNVLWSNVQTQKPVYYSQSPKVNVSRRNKTKDPVGRVASIVLENCLQNSLAMEDFDLIMNQVVEDRLLPGSGVAMVEYVPQVDEDRVGWQAAETRYINWQDWITNTARTWQEVEFFAYKAYLTRKEAVEIARNYGGDSFAADVAKDLVLDHRQDKKDSDGGGIGGEDDGPAKATVWCIWDKNGEQLIQLATGYPKAPLAVLPPPVNFDGFFPIPRPLQSSTTNDSTLPVPDFEQYVDQADEIDLMTQRINILGQALRMRGLYPADMDSLKTLMDSGDADMIPYDQWQMIMERGGINALVLWFPVEAIAKTLMNCIELRDKAVQIMYEITGIGDIQRGATDPQETASAQQLKAQFGSIRTRQSQRDVQRFIRDLLRLKAEVICENFELDTIKVMSGLHLLTDKEKPMVQTAMQLWQQYGQLQKQYQQVAQQPPQPGQMPPPPPQQPPMPQPSEEMVKALDEPSWDQIMAVLSNEKTRGFVVDVETDSTIEPDQQAQQAAATGFVTAVAQFMTAALPIMQAEPESVDFLGELMSWTTRQWKAADTIEGAVDEFIEKMKNKIQQMQQMPPQPDPRMQVEQIKADTAKVKGQAEVQKAGAEVQVAQTQAQVAQVKAAADVAGHQHDVQRQALELQKAGADAVKAMALAQKAREKPESGESE